VADKEKITPGKETPEDISVGLGNEILNLVGQRTHNPSEAFVLLQQLAIYLWDQYQIDWKDQPNHKMADTRKQRYLDFLSDLIESLLASRSAEQPK
jgi:hypothetical protein